MWKLLVAVAWTALVAALVAAIARVAVTQRPLVDSGSGDKSGNSAQGPTSTVAFAQTPELSPGLPCGVRCGTERWAVKTMSDGDRRFVDMRPVLATVESLAALPREPGRANARGGDAERRVFRVRGYLAATKDEKDGDLHLVIFGLSNQRLSLIAEIPDPACAGACRSGLASQYAAARAATAACAAQANPTDRAIVVEVEGVGFFDRNHGQLGRAPNAFELHPVLKVSCAR